MLAVAHILGLMMAVFGLLYLLPIAWSLGVGDGAVIDFVAAAGINIVVGTGVALATRRFRRELKPRDGFLLVTLSWVLMSGSAAIPLMIALPDLVVHGRVLRGDVGSDDHRFDGVESSRRPAAVDQPVAPYAALDRRHRHHRARRRRAALVGRRRHAAIQGGNAGPGEGREADAAHHRNCEGVVVHLSRDHGGRHRGAAHRGHDAGSTRSVTASRRSRSADSRRTTRASVISIRPRSSSC